jgi:hypothetical protein
MSNAYNDQRQFHTVEWKPKSEVTAPAPASAQEWKEPPTVTTTTTYDAVVEAMTAKPQINLREIAERKGIAKDIAAAARRERAHPTGADAPIKWQAPPPGWRWVADRNGAEHLQPDPQPINTPNVAYVPPKSERK